MTGQTGSTNFPTVAAIDTSLGGFLDGFVVKLNQAGTELVYSTYLGGTSSIAGFDEQGLAIAIDSAGNAHVTGLTASSDFPITPDALDPTFDSVHEPFVTKLDPGGSLAYSTFLPAALERAQGIALDLDGNAYVTGHWTNNGQVDIFVIKLAIAPVPAALTLSPANATRIAGEQHCLTATVLDQTGHPVAGVAVQVRSRVSTKSTSSSTSTGTAHRT